MSRSRPLRIAALAAIVALGLSTQAVGQTDEERAGARALARQGATAFNAGQWEDAVRYFQRAEDFVHAPPHLVFMARAHIELGNLVEARELLLRVKNEGLPATAPKAFHAAQAAAIELIPKLAPRIPQLTVNIENVEGQELLIQIDDKRLDPVFIGVPRAVNPGKHTVSAIGDGVRAEPVELELDEGAREAVTLTLVDDPSAKLPGAAPPPEAEPVPAEEAAPEPTSPADVTADQPSGGGPPAWPMYVAFGVGGVGIVLGSVFTASSASSRSEADDLFTSECESRPPNDPCRQGDPTTDRIAELDDDAGSAQTLAIVSYAVGGVGIAAGATLLILNLTGDDATAELDGTRITPVVGFGTAGVRGSF